MAIPYLEWLDEDQHFQRLEIVDKVFIGRTCHGVDPDKRIILADPKVSRDHAVISWHKKGHLLITDMSKNGTWVNEVRLAFTSPYELEDGDRIRIGKSYFQFFYPREASGDKNGWLIESTVVTPIEVVVTNLVADMRGFTDFSQTHTSVEVYALMKKIFEGFVAVVHQFKGTIKDFAGDAVFAFWPHLVEPFNDLAVSACQAAIRQSQVLNTIIAGLSDTSVGLNNLGMGWGITTGKVTMSHYGSQVADMALVGDCINLAFRLSDMANKEILEKIIMCSETAKLIRNDLGVKDLGFVSVKGRKGKERIFALS